MPEFLKIQPPLTHLKENIPMYTGALSHKAVNHLKELETAQKENNTLCDESDERVGRLETELSHTKHRIWALKNKITAEGKRIELQKDIANAFD